MSHIQDTANQHVLSLKWTDLQHQSLKIHPTLNDNVNLVENNNNVPIQVDDSQENDFVIWN